MERNGSRFPSIGFASVATRVFAVVGLIALIGVGMWGSVKIAQNVPNVFSAIASAFVGLTSIFVPAGETITLSAPSLIVQSGAPFTLSWTHEEKSVEGSYTFRYDCADSAYFTSPAVSGDETTVYCNVPFNFVNANDAIVLTPFATGSQFTDVTVYVDFTPNGVSRATVTGEATLTIENDSFAAGGPTTPPAARPTTPRTPGPSTTQTFPIAGGGQPSDPSGYVDLAAVIIETGVVDKTTGAFTASSTPTRSSAQTRVAIRFSITNAGTKTSPQFDFNAVLPTLPSHIFSSPVQQALAPDDRIEFTLAFDSFDSSGTGTFTVNVDPSGRINERNKSNNIVHYTITTSP